MLVAVLIFVMLELCASYLFYLKSSSSGSFALNWAVARVYTQFSKPVENFPADLSRSQLDDGLCSEVGLPLLKVFSERYTHDFSKLVASVGQTSGHLILLYLPLAQHQGGYCRQFFQQLALEQHIEFVDVSELFATYLAEQVYLLPEDKHLSRLGHQLIAQALAPRLAKIAKFRSNIRHGASDKALGNMPSNVDEIRTIMAERPFSVISNNQGFRIDKNLDAKTQWVLALGDSFTFGPHLSNIDVYSSLLNQMLSQQTVINAGVSGYGISDELAFYEQRLRYIGADVVILQTSPNDLSDFFWFIKNENQRSHLTFQPIAEELEFIDRLRQRKR
jgi:lysophospholipase L1-like esterase